MQACTNCLRRVNQCINTHYVSDCSGQVSRHSVCLETSFNYSKVLLPAHLNILDRFHSFFGPLFYAVKLVRYDSGLFCEFRWDPPSDTEEALKISWVVFLCLSTLSAIAQTVMYASIIVFLYRQKDNRHLASEITLRQARTNRKVFSMLVSVVMVFYSVWIPYHVERFIHFFRPNIKVSCVFFWTTNIFLNLLYPSVNPVIYYVFNEKYCHGFQELLRCHWSCSDTCGDCLHTSEISHSENNAPADAAQMSDGVENTKL